MNHSVDNCRSIIVQENTKTIPKNIMIIIFQRIFEPDTIFSRGIFFLFKNDTIVHNMSTSSWKRPWMIYVVNNPLQFCPQKITSIWISEKRSRKVPKEVSSFGPNSRNVLSNRFVQ